ncbi:hypothetical protein F2Q69_00034321 [Brassica cretica]|uniref:Uncharacterized protein n=1 Tax=Brassica cretica TaxID=69181 RepID=A0A8S9SFS8_BRACR|nr:hypothetical protein F2Q69_00034321 [Brassica cretica]
MAETKMFFRSGFRYAGFSDLEDFWDNLPVFHHMILIFHSFKGFLMRWFSSSTHLKVFQIWILYADFSDMEDFLDDLPVSRLKYNALDHFDFQKVFQTTSWKSSRRLPGSLDFLEVF